VTREPASDADTFSLGGTQLGEALLRAELARSGEMARCTDGSATPAASSATISTSATRTPGVARAVKRRALNP
jgi:hypothetical protein